MLEKNTIELDFWVLVLEDEKNKWEHKSLTMNTLTLDWASFCRGLLSFGPRFPLLVRWSVRKLPEIGVSRIAKPERMESWPEDYNAAQKAMN
jgi:hypothetical protein